MRITHLLSLAALSVAFVIPSDDVMSQVAIESDRTSESVLDKIPSKERLTEDIESTFASAIDHSKNAIDDALDYVSTSVEGVTEKLEEEYFDTKAWLEAEATSFGGDLEKPPHKGKRPHGPRHGHHGPHHKPNLTVFELISKSKYTTKLAELISEYDDLVDLLNGTTANFTVFAPTNRAFEKIPKHAPKPPKEFIKKLLTYHVSADFYPAGRVLSSGTIPTLLEGEYLSESPKDTPQRLSLHIGLRGLTVNYYSRVVAVNIVSDPYTSDDCLLTLQFGTNGVIHGVDSFIIPPPKIAKTISFFPGEFSTLELGLVKTGLYDVVNDTSTHLGGTFFAPSNFAFKKLGPKINAFLFSRFGGKYLKALLKYHVVPCQTLYSDAYYTATGSQENVKDVPKGLFHVCTILYNTFSLLIGLG